MISEKIIDNLIEILDKNFLNDKKIRLNIKSLLEKDLLTDNICNSFTNKGKRCKNKKKPDELYCGVHLKEKEKLKKYLMEKNIIKEKVLEDKLVESEDEPDSPYASDYELELQESEDDDKLPDYDYEDGDGEVDTRIDIQFEEKLNIKEEKIESIKTSYTSGDELDFDY
jgi:hypothetical protein